MLGHGAGGGIEAPDLVALTALTADGWLVVRVEQPWRVAGRRIATPPAQLDTAWLAVLRGADHRPRAAARARSSWAAAAPGPGWPAAPRRRSAPAAVLALSFPLHPPGRPEKSRADEARLVTDAGLPLAVVQGERDAFGGPDEVRAALGERGRGRGRRGARTRSPRTRPTWSPRCAAWLARCGDRLRLERAGRPGNARARRRC